MINQPLSQISGLSVKPHSKVLNYRIFYKIDEQKVKFLLQMLGVAMFLS